MCTHSTFMLTEGFPGAFGTAARSRAAEIPGRAARRRTRPRTPPGGNETPPVTRALGGASDARGPVAGISAARVPHAYFRYLV